MEINHNFVQLNDICNYLNIKISHIFHRSLDSKWHFDNQSNDYNRIYFVLDGEGYLYNDKEKVILEPYNIYFIPANSTYNYRCDNYLEKVFIHFKLSIIPNKDVMSGVKNIVKIKSSKEETDMVKTTFYKEDIESAIFCQNLVRNIAFEVLRPYTDEINNDIKLYKKYRDIYKYVERNLSADLSVADVCKHIGFSQTYIGQKFKNDTEQTIKSYISDMLIDRMKWLLQSGRALSTVSEELKFNDLSYCSKFFKKHTGISPREYIKKHLI